MCDIVYLTLIHQIFAALVIFFREPNTTVTDSFYYPTEFVHYETFNKPFGFRDQWLLDWKFYSQKGDNFTCWKIFYNESIEECNSLQEEVSHWISLCSIWIIMMYKIPMCHCVSHFNIQMWAGIKIFGFILMSFRIPNSQVNQ